MMNPFLLHIVFELTRNYFNGGCYNKQTISWTKNAKIKTAWVNVRSENGDNLLLR